MYGKFLLFSPNSIEEKETERFKKFTQKDTNTNQCSQYSKSVFGFRLMINHFLEVRRVI